MCLYINDKKISGFDINKYDAEKIKKTECKKLPCTVYNVFGFLKLHEDNKLYLEFDFNEKHFEELFDFPIDDEYFLYLLDFASIKMESKINSLFAKSI